MFTSIILSDNFKMSIRHSHFCVFDKNSAHKLYNSQIFPEAAVRTQNAKRLAAYNQQTRSPFKAANNPSRNQKRCGPTPYALTCRALKHAENEKSPPAGAIPAGGGILVSCAKHFFCQPFQQLRQLDRLFGRSGWDMRRVLHEIILRVKRYGAVFPAVGAIRQQKAGFDCVAALRFQDPPKLLAQLRIVNRASDLHAAV